ncbi:RNA pseudouridine synthase 3 mitochondrial [Bienertia sinuspersici]
MGRTKESTYYLQQLFTYMNVAKTSCLAWNDACETTSMKHWRLVIGSPREKGDVICAPLTKALFFLTLLSSLFPHIKLKDTVKGIFHEVYANLTNLLGHVLLDDGKTKRVMLAHPSAVEASQEAMTEYRVLRPMINGCSWIELRPLTSRKHQVTSLFFCLIQLQHFV